MAKAIALRGDYAVNEFRALAGTRDGLNRTEATRPVAMDAQALRRWVLVFNAEASAA